MDIIHLSIQTVDTGTPSPGLLQLINSETSYPFAGVGHLLPLGPVKGVMVLLGRAGIQGVEHCVGVLHGGQRALWYPLIYGLVDGNHSSMY